MPAPDWAQKMLHIVKSQIINSFTLFRDAIPVLTPPEEDNTGRITEPQGRPVREIKEAIGVLKRIRRVRALLSGRVGRKTLY